MIMFNGCSPTSTRSSYNRSAPILTVPVALHFQLDGDMRSELLLNFKRMLQFWGFEVLNEGTEPLFSVTHSFLNNPDTYLKNPATKVIHYAMIPNVLSLCNTTVVFQNIGPQFSTDY